MTAREVLDQLRKATIGKSPECDVRVHDDPHVSAVHAAVTRDDQGMFWVKDVGSLNGTWIQRAGEPLPSHPRFLTRVMGWTRMNPGDTLWLSQKSCLTWDGLPPSGSGPVKVSFTEAWRG